MTLANQLPTYMQILGNKIYNNFTVSSVLDDNRVVTFLNLWANLRKNAHVTNRTAR